MRPTSILSIPQAANFLQVSAATIRNWQKNGLIDDPLSFRDVETLRQNIQSGEINRLNKRANKTVSSRRFIPTEYTDQACLSSLQSLVQSRKENHRNESLADFIFSWLYVQGEVNERMIFRRKNVRSSFEKLYPDYIHDVRATRPMLEVFAKLVSESSTDIPGIIYQSHLTEGSKSKTGSYYTPASVTRELVGSLSAFRTFLDPCCGTGNFLLAAAEYAKTEPENLIGFDIDPIAVELARLNVLMKFPEKDFSPSIYHANTLTDELHQLYNHKVDAIATNPPWGAITNHNHNLSYKESFSNFLDKSFYLLRDGGECAMLLPESILNIGAHRTIRKHLLDNTTLHSIKEHGRLFNGVFTKVISLKFKKEKAPAKHSVIFLGKEKQSIFQRDISDERIETGITSNDRRIINKIYSLPHTTLKDHSEWALGIVTGNNAEFLSDKKLRGFEAIVKGSDIKPYNITKPSTYIKFDKNRLQQVAREDFYRSKEKLVYKFISNKLVFAYDNTGTLTLNSANILIPKIPGIHIKVVMAFLNSGVFQFLFEKKFRTHKVLRQHLESMPFPQVDRTLQSHIITLTKSAVNKDKIDKLICQLFDLPENFSQ